MMHCACMLNLRKPNFHSKFPFKIKYAALWYTYCCSRSYIVVRGNYGTRKIYKLMRNVEENNKAIIQEDAKMTEQEKNQLIAALKQLEGIKRQLLELLKKA